MVSQPTALKWVGFSKIGLKIEYVWKTLPNEEYELVIWKICKPSTKSFKQGIRQNYISWKTCRSHDHQHSKSIKPISYSWKQNHEKTNKVSVQVLCETYHHENIQLSSIRNSL